MKMWPKKWVQSAACFLAGVGVGVVIHVFMTFSESQIEPDPCVQLVREWRISRPLSLDNMLVVPIGDSNRHVWLTRDPDSGSVYEASLVSTVTKTTMIEYTLRGELGRPEIRYHGERPQSRDHTTLVDLNVDGTFDLLYDTRPSSRGRYIALGSNWVRITASEGLQMGVTTEDGQFYRFDIVAGNWARAPKREPGESKRD